MEILITKLKIFFLCFKFQKINHSPPGISKVLNFSNVLLYSRNFLILEVMNFENFYLFRDFYIFKEF